MKSKSSLSKYLAVYKHLKEFIYQRYRMSDIALKELTPAFITDFDMFLRVDKHCCNNTVWIYTCPLRTMVSISINNGWLTRFLVSGGDKFRPLEVADIAYFYSENKITFAVTNSGQEYIIDLSLQKLEEQLNPDQFFRANRQMLLCVKAIDHIEPYFNGKIVVFVKPPYKSQITISEEKITAFKLWLNF